MNKVDTNITRKYNNDCWCTSISKSTGLSYDKVYKDFKPFLADNKGAHIQTIKSYLENKGYIVISVELSLKESLQVYNTNEESKTMFSLKHEDENGHMIYIKNGVIYDEVREFDLDTYIEYWNVDYVFIKERV